MVRRSETGGVWPTGNSQLTSLSGKDAEKAERETSHFTVFRLNENGGTKKREGYLKQQGRLRNIRSQQKKKRKKRE